MPGYDVAMDTATAYFIDRIRAAAADRTPLRIRGGGSKDFHGISLHGDVLDTRSCAGIVSYEPSELVITVKAGTALAQVEAALAEQGQYLPFEPPYYEHAYPADFAHSTSVDNAVPSVSTVGGMVAAGWSGPARANVGAVRDYVLGVNLINGKGELLVFGGQVMKNVAGYDVSRLMVGAWGTLGLLTQVSLKVLPKPPAEATIRFVCDQATALRKLNRWGGQPLPLNASCWLQEQGQGTLYVRLRGAVAAVEAACSSMLRELNGKRMELASTQEDWQACRNHTLPWMQSVRQSGMALWRFSVPATAPVLQLPEGVTSPLVEWHGALRWVQAPVESGAAMRECAMAAGGSASLFVAERQGGSSGGGGFGLKNDVLANLHQRIKESFDPMGILNPGRMATHW